MADSDAFRVEQVAKKMAVFGAETARRRKNAPRVLGGNTKLEYALQLGPRVPEDPCNRDLGGDLRPRRPLRLGRKSPPPLRFGRKSSPPPSRRQGRLALEAESEGGGDACMQVFASLLEFAVSHHWKGEGRAIVRESSMVCLLN